jgi:hypothetical protein
MSTRTNRSMREIDVGEGLHVLKRDHFQKQYMGAQCDALRAGLARAIEATLAAAPVRREPYVLDRAALRIPKGPEARWEQAIWNQWSRAESLPAVGAWERIVSYQVMLRDTNGDAGWGEIDLLGVTEDARPVVIELKAPGASDTPAAMLVEAASYGLALQKAWLTFERQWRERLLQLGIDGASSSPAATPTIQLVCAAPTAYWANWIGSSPNARRVSAATRRSLADLTMAFADRGIHTVFVSLANANEDEDRIPCGLTTAIVDPTRGQ